MDIFFYFCIAWSQHPMNVNVVDYSDGDQHPRKS